MYFPCMLGSGTLNRRAIINKCSPLPPESFGRTSLSCNMIGAKLGETVPQRVLQPLLKPPGGILANRGLPKGCVAGRGVRMNFFQSPPRCSYHD